MALKIPAYDEEIRIELLWDQAPRTCAAVWAELPIDKPAFHGRRSGQELFILADPFESPGSENARATVRAGDVVFLYLPPDWTDEHPDFPQDERGMFDIAFIYGPDALVRGPHGLVEANLFGRVVAEDLPRLAAACERMWLEGMEQVRLCRAEV